MVLWFTLRGLSGSGKSTVAAAAEKALIAKGRWLYRLTGTTCGTVLNADLGFFSGADRFETSGRAAEAAALFRDSAVIALAAFISRRRRCGTWPGS
jgi:adenylylsulfate kinase-like enzyme